MCPLYIVGSTVFAKNLVGDLLLTPALARDTQIALHDIDPERLRTSEIVARWIARSLRLDTHVSASMDRREILKNADYVILMMNVGGYCPSMASSRNPASVLLNTIPGSSSAIGRI